jgi:phage replication initiation protein
MENSYLFDWLSFTVPVKNYNDLSLRGVRSFLKEVGLDFNFEPRKKGAYGYLNSLSYANAINVLYTDLEHPFINSDDRLKQALDMGIHIEMTGQGCRYFEGVENYDWVEFFNLLRSLGAKFKRLDIALDDYKKMIKFSTVKEKIRSGEVVSLSRKRDVIETKITQKEEFNNKGDSKGLTVYFGTRASNIYIRFYDKKKEQEGKGIKVDVSSWQRYEIVLRNEKATDFIERFCEGETFDTLYLGVLSGAIRFIDKGTDSNKARWETSPFWIEFLRGAEAIKLKSHKVTPDIGKTINWYGTSAFSATLLLSWVAEDRGLDFSEILKDSKRELSERHQLMKAGYEGLNDEEKREIGDKIRGIGLG